MALCVPPHPHPSQPCRGGVHQDGTSDDETTSPIPTQFCTENAMEGCDTNRSSADCDDRSELAGRAYILPPPPVGESQGPSACVQKPCAPPRVALRPLAPGDLVSPSSGASSSCSSTTQFDIRDPSPPGDFNEIFVKRVVACPGGEVALPLTASSVQYESLSMEKDIKTLRAIDLSDYERYTRGYCYKPNHHEDWKATIMPGPLATSFKGPAPPSAWKVYVHPEGARYFYCDDPRCPVPVITEAWLYDGKVRDAAQNHVVSIFEFMRRNGIDFRRQVNLPEGDEEVCTYFQHSAPVVLVLEERLTKNFGYYFVDHERRRLFWLDRYDFSWCTGEVHIEHTESSMGLEMTSQYWTHNELFPHLYELTLDDLVEIDDMISFTFGDVLTSDTSAVGGYSLDQLRDVRDVVVSHRQRSWEDRRKSCGERRTICRVIGNCYHERFLNLHGERGVRLDSKQSIYYSRRRETLANPPQQAPETNDNHSWCRWIVPAFLFSGARAGDGGEPGKMRVDHEASRMHRSSPLLKLATFFMFGGPYVHATRLREIAMDHIVNDHLLERYTTKMVAEWRDVALYGTVLLGANVAFLAIQSVDTVQGPGPRTAAQRASYFSVLASLGTIVSSLVLLILVRHREVMGNRLIRGRCQSRWGLESLALMYGTPFSLVIWAILGFFVSFAIVWFESKDKWVIFIFSICLFAFLIFLGWAVSASYMENEPYLFFGTKAFTKIRKAGKRAVVGACVLWPALCGWASGNSGADADSGSNSIGLQAV